MLENVMALIGNPVAVQLPNDVREIIGNPVNEKVYSTNVCPYIYLKLNILMSS